MNIDWDAIFNVIDKATPAATKIINTLKKKPKKEQAQTAQAIMTGVNVPGSPSSGGGVNWTTLALVGGVGVLGFLAWRRR